MSMPMPVKSSGLAKQTQTVFGGLNASPSAQEGEIVDMLNLTTDLYPRMATRERKNKTADVDEPGGMVWIFGELHVKDGTGFHRATGYTAAEETPWADEDEVEMVVMGNYMIARYVDDPTIVMEDVKDVYRYAEYLYPGTELKWGTMQVSYSAQYGTNKGLTFGISGVSAGGNKITIQTGQTAWKDLSEEDFRAGDCVTISGCTKHTANNKSAVIQSFGDGSEHPILFTDNCFELDTVLTHTVPSGGYSQTDAITSEKISVGGIQYKVGFSAAISEGEVITVDIRTDTPTVTPSSCYLQAGTTGATEVTFAETEVEYTEPATVTITRRFPHMDFMFVHDNRLMGGAGDTIYVSALGDPFNLEKFEGLASDSWQTETGTPGDFVGGIVYGGYPRFFKKDAIYTLYGDYTGEYTLYRQDCAGMGLEATSRKSLAVCNGVLYYLSTNGVCGYTGGDPVLVGTNMGEWEWYKGVGSTDGLKYFLETGSTSRKLFVLDTEKSTWVVRDAPGAMQMCYGDGRCWYLTDPITGAGELGAMEKYGKSGNEGVFSWYAEFKEVTGGTPDKKKISEMQIRAKLAAGASMTVRMSYDGGEYETVAHREAMEETMCILPLRPKRFDRCKMRIEGTGDVEIESITKKYAAGSARRGG